MSVEELGAYCERAVAHGVSEIAVTEHLFRFVQADGPLRGWWDDDEAGGDRGERRASDPALRDQAAAYWAEHQGADLDQYVTTVLEAKAAGLPIVLGMEVDYYPGRMDKVQALLDGYPFDVLLGSVHWIGTWLFDVLESAIAQAEWDNRGLEQCWDAYTRAIEELAGTAVCDVLAHPDLAKVAGRRPTAPEEFHERIAEAAATCGIAAEVSSAGWRKPMGEAYPAPDLLSRFFAKGVPVTTASDAHRLEDVAWRAADLKPLVAAAGYDSLVSFRARRPTPVPL